MCRAFSFVPSQGCAPAEDPEAIQRFRRASPLFPHRVVHPLEVQGAPRGSAEHPLCSLTELCALRRSKGPRESFLRSFTKLGTLLKVQRPSKACPSFSHRVVRPLKVQRPPRDCAEHLLCAPSEGPEAIQRLCSTSPLFPYRVVRPLQAHSCPEVVQSISFVPSPGRAPSQGPEAAPRLCRHLFCSLTGLCAL